MISLYKFKWNSAWRTPSNVQTQLTHGDILSDFPIESTLFWIIQEFPLSRQWVKSILGIELQGIRGFLKEIIVFNQKTSSKLKGLTRSYRAYPLLASE
jgi:hypothetical protein